MTMITQLKIAMSLHQALRPSFRYPLGIIFYYQFDMWRKYILTSKNDRYAEVVELFYNSRKEAIDAFWAGL